MIARGLTVFLIAVVMLWVATGNAQQNAPFRYSHCPDPAICCVVPAPRMTQPVPGGTPTSVVEAAVNLFGAHVSNLNTAERYLQFFNATAEPHPGATPIGSSSWSIAPGRDRDIDVGSGGGGSGWAFTDGIMACCSSNQRTFTPANDCGFLLQYY